MRRRRRIVQLRQRIALRLHRAALQLEPAIAVAVQHGILNRLAAEHRLATEQHARQHAALERYRQHIAELAARQ